MSQKSIFHILIVQVRRGFGIMAADGLGIGVVGEIRECQPSLVLKIN